MAIKGSLKEASLADVCQLLALGLKTGCLSIADKSRFGQIYFDKGRITYARVVNRRDRLGDLLVRDGLLSQDQLTAALELQRAHPDRKLGELLISRHFMNEQDLHLYIRIQIEEAIYHLFTWSRGNFFFEADERPDADITVSINPDTLLLEAARRVDEWSQIEKKIPSLDLIFEIDQERLSDSDLQLTRDQRRIVELFDGTRSVQDVVEEIGMGESDDRRGPLHRHRRVPAHDVDRRCIRDLIVDGQASRQELIQVGLRQSEIETVPDRKHGPRLVQRIPRDDGKPRVDVLDGAVRHGRQRRSLLDPQLLT
jgi:hypothetical protein